MKSQTVYSYLRNLLTVLIGIAVTACSGTASTSTPPVLVSTATLNATESDGMNMNFDQMFIDMMVPHHQAAVEMAKVALQRADHEEIKQLAEAIISQQEEEIDQLRAWRQAWYDSDQTPPMSQMPMIPGLSQMPGMGGMDETHMMDMAKDVESLRNAPEPFDLAFIDAMIPHHQLAVAAAMMAEQGAARQELKDLAQAIIEGQQKEIGQMQTWRQGWFSGVTPAMTATP